MTGSTLNARSSGTNETGIRVSSKCRPIRVTSGNWSLSIWLLRTTTPRAPFGIDRDEREIAAGAAGMGENVSLLLEQRQPPPEAARSPADCLEMHGLRAADRPAKYRARGRRQVGGEKRQHVVHVRSEPAGSGKGFRRIPVLYPLAARVVTRRNLRHPRGTDDLRGRHPQRLEDASGHERFVRRAGTARKRVAEQPDADIRVFRCHSNVPPQFVQAQKVIELRHRVVHVGIASVARGNVGHARQAGRMGGQVHQTDPAAVAGWHDDITG